MALYDYGCKNCDHEEEKAHKMAEAPLYQCPRCDHLMVKLLTTGAPKLPDSPWIEECANGAMNDLSEVRKGRQPKITTREQARAHIRRDYANPYPRPKNDSEVAANKRLTSLRTRYLERY